MTKKYNLVLADNPWNFDAWDPETGGDRSPERHYNTLDADKLKRLNLAPVLADNCALILWIVKWHRPSLAEEIAAAWGRIPGSAKTFTYRTRLLTWVKTTKTNYAPQPGIPYYLDPGRPRYFEAPKYKKFPIGTGYYTRSNIEIALLFVRGSMPVMDRGVPELIIAPRLAHSAKPEAQYNRISRLWPEAQKLELFARSKRPGWDVWGNEVKSDIELKFLEEVPEL